MRWRAGLWELFGWNWPALLDAPWELVAADTNTVRAEHRRRELQQRQQNSRGGDLWR